MNTYRQIRRTGLVAALAGAIALGVTATEARAQLRRDRVGGTLQPVGLPASVDTDRSQYPSRRDVQITLRLANTSRRSVSLNLYSSYEYDVLIRDARSGATVWQWSRQSGGVRRERRTIRLEPNETRTHRVRWDQTDDSGRQVRAGTYRIEARLYSMDPVTTEVRLLGDDRTENDRDPWGGRIPRPFPRPGGDDDRDDNDPRRYNSLRGELRAGESTVRAGDTVTFTYTVRNDSGRRQTYRFPTSQQYDIEVRSSRGRTVWRSSEGRVYAQAQSERTLEPGQQQEYRFSWRVDRDLDPGRYEAIGFLTPRGGGRDGVAEARTFLRIESR